MSCKKKVPVWEERWARRGKEKNNEAPDGGAVQEDPGSIKACTVVSRGINPAQPIVL